MFDLPYNNDYDMMFSSKGFSLFNDKGIKRRRYSKTNLVNTIMIVDLL